jgi:hypothetical protein
MPESRSILSIAENVEDPKASSKKKSFYPQGKTVLKNLIDPFATRNRLEMVAFHICEYRSDESVCSLFRFTISGLLILLSSDAFVF